MPLGPAVRRRLGRLEIPAADAYRARFINLDDCAEVIHSLFPDADRILEVGCGDGSFAQRLLERYLTAKYVGIDVAPEPGRLFRGDSSRVEFRSVDSTRFRELHPGVFDLVVVVDVVHHVAPTLRDQVLGDVTTLTRSGGAYVIKEWEPTRTVSHWVCWAADRFITGDHIQHVKPQHLHEQVQQRSPDELVAITRIPPRRNNYLLAYRRA